MTAHEQRPTKRGRKRGRETGRRVKEGLQIGKSSARSRKGKKEINVEEENEGVRERERATSGRRTTALVRAPSAAL